MEMHQWALQPEAISCSAAISAFEKSMAREGALELLNEMLSKVLLPDVVSFDAAISACEKGVH